MAKEWFSTGFEKARELSKNKGSGVGFRMKDGEEADVRFLKKNPICVYEHWVKAGTNSKPVTCLEGTDEACPLCKAKIPRRFTGSFPVIDRRDGKIKLYKVGIKILKVLDKLESKFGLKSRDITITRTGSGTDTQYNFTPGDKKATSEKEMKLVDTLDIKAMLKPKSRKEVLEMVKSSVKEDDEEADDDDSDDEEDDDEAKF